MFCKKCGSKIPDSSKFCPECGADVKDMIKKESVIEKTGGSAGKAVKGFFNKVGSSVKGITLMQQADTAFQEEQYEQAYKTYLEASKLGNGEAMDRLGQMYEKGLFVDKDLEQAEDWYYQGANKGSGEAIIHLGDLYSSEERYDLAFRYYTNVPFLKKDEVAYKIGEFYRLGKGVDKDLDQAIKYLTKASENVDDRDGNSRYHLALAYKEKDMEKEAYDAFKEAAGQGHVESMRQIGLMFENGFIGAPDLYSAYFYYQKAKDHGYEKVDQDYDRIIEKMVTSDVAEERILSKAIKGNPESQYELGKLYENGIHFLENEDKAWQWYEKAAEGHDGKALIKLGFRALSKEDLDEAKDDFQKANEAGDACGLMILNRMNENKEQIKQGHFVMAGETINVDPGLKDYAHLCGDYLQLAYACLKNFSAFIDETSSKEKILDYVTKESENILHELVKKSIGILEDHEISMIPEDFKKEAGEGLNYSQYLKPFEEEKTTDVQKSESSLTRSIKGAWKASVVTGTNLIRSLGDANKEYDDVRTKDYLTLVSEPYGTLKLGIFECIMNGFDTCARILSKHAQLHTNFTRNEQEAIRLYKEAMNDEDPKKELLFKAIHHDPAFIWAYDALAEDLSKAISHDFIAYIRFWNMESLFGKITNEIRHQIQEIDVELYEQTFKK